MQAEGIDHDNPAFAGQGALPSLRGTDAPSNQREGGAQGQAAPPDLLPVPEESPFLDRDLQAQGMSRNRPAQATQQQGQGAPPLHGTDSEHFPGNSGGALGSGSTFGTGASTGSGSSSAGGMGIPSSQRLSSGGFSGSSMSTGGVSGSTMSIEGGAQGGVAPGARGGFWGARLRFGLAGRLFWGIKGTLDPSSEEIDIARRC